MENTLDNNRYYANLLGLAGLIYPSYGVLMHFLAPDKYNDLPGRAFCGLLCLLAFAFRHRLGSRIKLVSHILSTVFMLHYWSLVVLSGGEERFFMGAMTLVMGISFLFLNSPRAYLVHIAIVVPAFFVYASSYGVLKPCAPLIRNLALAYISLAFITRLFDAHSKLIAKLRNEKTQLLEQQRNHLVNNMKDAQEVFSSLSTIEQVLPPGVQLRPFYRPATEAGGDWLGHFYSPERQWLMFAVGDVTGHDLVSSLVTIAVAGAVRGTWESQIQTSEDIQLLVTMVTNNAHMAVKFSGIKERAMTAVFVAVDLAKREAAVVSCAHPPIMMRQGSEMSAVSHPPSSCLGDRNFKYSLRSIKLSDDSALLLYTDGLVEDEVHPLSERKLLQKAFATPETYLQLTSFADQLSYADDVSFILFEFQTETATSSPKRPRSA